MAKHTQVDAVVKNGAAVPSQPEDVQLNENDRVRIIVGDLKARKRFMDFGSIVGLALALISVLLGIVDISDVLNIPDGFAFLIVGFWVITPPVFLWLDWVFYCLKTADKSFRDDAKHTHNLARNIWVALVVILIALFNLGQLINV